MVSEKSALGMNSVPTKRSMKTLSTKMPIASATVLRLCSSDQARIFW